MIKFTSIASITLLLTACATQTLPPEPKYDKEPLLVGIPLGERISSTNQNINSQFQLLSKVKSGQYVGKYEMVEHNNELDARKGSRNTLPQDYSQTKSSISKVVTEEVKMSKNTEVVKITELDESCNPKFQTKVKQLSWNNDSANELGKLISKGLGYQFVSTGDKDINITIDANNETLSVVLKKYKSALKGKADVVVVDKNKTFNVIYNK